MTTRSVKPLVCPWDLKLTTVVCQGLPFQALMADAVHGLGDTAAEVARSSAPTTLQLALFASELRAEGNQKMKAETKAERMLKGNQKRMLKGC